MTLLASTNFQDSHIKPDSDNLPKNYILNIQNFIKKFRNTVNGATINPNFQKDGSDKMLGVVMNSQLIKSINSAVTIPPTIKETNDTANNIKIFKNISPNLIILFKFLFRFFNSIRKIIRKG